MAARMAGSSAQSLATLDVGVDGAALDRARPDDRDLDRQLGEVLRTRAAAATASARGSRSGRRRSVLGALDRGEGLGVVEGDPREVDPLVASAGDQFDGALDRREHSQPEQVDLQKAGVGARVLVPVDELAALHRGVAPPGSSSRSAGGSRRSPFRRGAGRCGAAARSGLVRERHEPVPAAARLLLPASAQRAGDVALDAVPEAVHVPRTGYPHPARRVRSPPGAVPGPCPGRGSPRARDKLGKGRDERGAVTGRSARGRGGSAPRARRAGSRGRCPAARSAPG